MLTAIRTVTITVCMPFSVPKVCVVLTYFTIGTKYTYVYIVENNWELYVTRTLIFSA
jgi:hypothetical protein